ncbi:uncharacterized protein RAG0_00024 [Rhynchosporium agropyri]|uniref:Uncharacterized protein n=2 Tax=Rhynchosporium TaxID=38037 RepID=A0A1E1LYR1_RHYSE|nr:uncharacterized protein RAG0_00024 [Rhynchosporium agropyri]CZT41991.1 uncharacterized protein RSE6_01817 [Rhynchosporium secalis]
MNLPALHRYVAARSFDKESIRNRPATLSTISCLNALPMKVLLIKVVRHEFVLNIELSQGGRNTGVALPEVKERRTIERNMKPTQFDAKFMQVDRRSSLVFYGSHNWSEKSFVHTLITGRGDWVNEWLGCK